MLGLKVAKVPLNKLFGRYGMISKMMTKAISFVDNYINQNYTKMECSKIEHELQNIVGEYKVSPATSDLTTYEQVQSFLATLNEKESIRKSKGVYYTPTDVVRFILFNSFKFVSGKLKPNNLHVMDLNGIPYSSICYEKIIFDPTCGAGEFLLASLEIKMDLLDLHHSNVTKNKLKKVVNTIKGNDVNKESTTISKLRLYLSCLHRYGVTKSLGVSNILNESFMNYDYVSKHPMSDVKYDVIVGNPPYVEDSKCGLVLEKLYGNIYANVLDNAAHQLKRDGVLGFIIPLSYVSTPRMRKIREDLYEYVPIQYLLNYSDRPDCLFTSVHQKLSILFAKKKGTDRAIYSGNYTYWYKDEREDLFTSAQVVSNKYVEDKFIPKLGTKLDSDIYSKIINNKEDITSLFDNGTFSIYLNMRATFWIKAFLNKHNGSEYKEMKSSNDSFRKYAVCLLNSSLFWWYWVCVSDCWHITRKELNGFKIPIVTDYKKLDELAVALENKLEETKVYVGKKQTEYEYKHRLCIAEIHAIDDYINKLFGLTKEESLHIKNFAYRYRVSGGTAK